MKIALSRLRTSTLSWLANELITESNPDKYPFIKDNPLLRNLQTTYNEYQQVFGKKSYSGKGKLVAQANLVQNDAYNGMKFCIYGLTRVSGNSLQADANDLYHLFKIAGVSLSRRGYMTKSTKLSKLIETLEQPDNKAKIERIHLTEVFEILKAAYLNFENLSLDQISANAQLRRIGTASGLRKKLEKAIHYYLTTVTAMSEFDEWKHFYLLLDEHVKSARNSHRKSDKTATEQDTES